MKINPKEWLSLSPTDRYMEIYRFVKTQKQKEGSVINECSRSKSDFQ
ncbi:hypothetical protein J19TS1_07740 [Heyndrickxia oleronia]|nr:hypothetical protein J19TS1_07740 [Heyndrickxia oleronia]